MPNRPIYATRDDPRPNLYDRSQACREVLRHGQPIDAVARKYNTDIPTLKSWLRVARKRDKLKYTRPYPTIPYST
jgi:hypothetical protein